MQRRRLHRHRQDQRARVRSRVAHVQRGLRHDPQPVRPRRAPPGGSSGGAAVALATRMLPVADGSDYMGSLRNPAAWNNVFGFRPSQGRVPGCPSATPTSRSSAPRARWGARVLDVALLLGTQAGDDRRVPLSLAGGSTSSPTVASARATLGDDPTARRRASAGSATSAATWRWSTGILDAVRSAGSHGSPSLGCRPSSRRRSPSTSTSCGRPGSCGATSSSSAGLGRCVADPARRGADEAGGAVGGRSAALRSPARRSTVPPRRAPRSTARSSRCSSVSTCSRSPPPRCGRSPRPSDGRARIGDRTMDTYHRWMEVDDLRHVRRAAGDQRARRLRRARAADGHAADRPPARRRRSAAVAHAYETTIADLHIGEA